MSTANQISYTRINNDVNGNPRYVVHYLNFLHDSEGNNYELAIAKARAIGGKKYHNKQYGGGIAFQSYNIDSTLADIEKIASKPLYFFIEVCDVKVYLSAKCLNEGVKFPNSDSSTLHNEFRVTVQTPRARTSFKFYGSHVDWQANKTDLQGNDLINAFYCFISDAASGNESFDEFCGNMGYDTDSREAHKIYKACRRSLDNYNKICPDNDIYDFINELTDKYNC